MNEDAAIEQTLRRAVLAGDETAWRALYDRAFDGLYAFVASRCVRDRDRTDDVVQETWLIAVRRLRDFDPDRAAFGAWLRGIAAFVLRNRGRRDAGRARVEATSTDAAREPAAESAPAHGGETAERVSVALAGLPAAYGAVLRAKYRDGLTVAEIAARTGRTSKATESLLSRAREAFRRVFAELEREP